MNCRSVPLAKIIITYLQYKFPEQVKNDVPRSAECNDCEIFLYWGVFFFLREPFCLSAWFRREIRKLIIGEQNVLNKILEGSTTCSRKITLLPPLSLNVVRLFCLEGDMSNWKHEDDILLCYCASFFIRCFEALTNPEVYYSRSATVEVITQPTLQNILQCVYFLTNC